MVRRRSRVTPRDNEVRFAADEIIVSKTDPQGRITYANEIFIDISGYTEEELIGQPHNILRHPDVPGGVFKLVWETIEAGQEIFVYVKNLTKDGSYYWVLAHMTPSYDSRGTLTGYHSSRRCPEPAAIAEVGQLYSMMCAAEAKHEKAPAAAEAGHAVLTDYLNSKGATYEEYIWDVIARTCLGSQQVAGVAR